MPGDGEQIVIVRPRKAEHAAHGGSWKVAYADFVTAMMAFFIVMWILGLSPETRRAVAEYFQDPSASKAVIAARAGLGGSGSGASKELSLIDMAQQRYQKMKKELEGQIAKSERLKDKSVEITVTEDGLRVELMDTGTSPFFEIGSAEMKPETAELLSVIGEELKGEDRVSVEGHTDARELSRENYSNWELSCDRANAARRVLEPILLAGQIDAIRGYADTKLRVTDDPMAPQNRRVTILVKPTATVEEGADGDEEAAAEPAEGATTEEAAPPGSGGDATSEEAAPAATE